MKITKRVKNGLKPWKRQSKQTKSRNSNYMNGIYDIGNKLLNNKIKIAIFFLIFTFSKKKFLCSFHFGPKTP